MKTDLRFLFLAALCFILVSGCHSTSAVVRATTVSKAPSFECISNAVIHVPGVTQVITNNVSPDPSWSVYHRYSRQLPYENFLYLGEHGMRGMITLKPQWKAPTVLQFSKIWVDKTPSNDEVNATRSLMDNIYSAISQECGGLPPADNVQEQFLNLKHYEKYLATRGNGATPAQR